MLFGANKMYNGYEIDILVYFQYFNFVFQLFNALPGLQKTALDLTETRRAVLAKVYNEKLVMYDWHLPMGANEIHERTTNLTRIKLEKSVEMLENTIQHLQNQIGIEDLTEEEVIDLQLVLLNDDDGRNRSDSPEIEATGSKNYQTEFVPENGESVEMEENIGMQEPRVLLYDSVSGHMGYVLNVWFHYIFHRFVKYFPKYNFT